MNKSEWDSKEEMYFSWYLDELFINGFIKSYERQPDSYLLLSKITYPWKKQLKTKVKDMESPLFQAHNYTADFKIVWDYVAHDTFFAKQRDGVQLNTYPFVAQDIRDGEGNIVEENISIIEIKPSFDMQNMTRLFGINQKWVYDRYGVYVQKIVVTGTKGALFPTTFTPERYFLTDKSMKPRKLNYEAGTLRDYLGREAA